MDPQDFENLNSLLDREVDLREKIKDQIADLDKKMRNAVGMLNKIHSTPSASMPTLLNGVRPVLLSCRETTRALADIIPENQFWRWKDMWSNSLRNAVFAATLIEYLSTRTLLSLSQVSELLGTVNAVTLGNFEEPIRISIFVKDLFTGFSMV
ncbi:hypothetical protein C0991_009126 [Blastosporella zonata]|nr:hypothetical protein C0991_009126 [Blastosporella zonata]